ncbi:MAG TPA: hypothetical protein VD858_15290 [Reyranella sp.]|nr:hypothetical protein [Reyranella sp.]
MTRPKFIIYAPTFNDTSGGEIALHHLCSRLNDVGEDACVWAVRPDILHGWPSLRNMAYRAKGWLRPYSTGPFANPIARRADLQDAIVVYPETTFGNPLRARNVVRWLLNKPGALSQGRMQYGHNDLYFFFQAAFDDPSLNSDPTNQLMLHWVNPIYRDRGLPGRRGTCHMMRKGAGRPIVHGPDSIAVDGLSHDEMADVFNRTERFYCYDLYTFYTIYAARCGCIPIVVPDPAIPKDKWITLPKDRYGVAYGEDDIPWALATRHELFRQGDAEHANEDDMITTFVAKCMRKFGYSG